MTESGLTIRPVTPTLGAEVFGIDLSKPLSGSELAAVRRALLDYQVIFFRDQQLTHEQHIAFGKRFGSLHVHPLKEGRHGEFPELLRIHADENSTRAAGEDWHTDVSCEAAPPMGSILYLSTVPETGGDTLFASMYAAYDALSEPMKQFLEPLTAIHDGGKPWSTYGYAPPATPYPKNEHPVIAVHPDTGRKLLFVNRGVTTRIPQLSKAESTAVLDMLYQHIDQPRFTCRFRWQPNSMAFWDNRCTQHQAIWDYFPNRRSGFRVTINGETPVGVAGAKAAPAQAKQDMVAA